jgi:hypothetical protein
MILGVQNIAMSDSRPDLDGKGNICGLHLGSLGITTLHLVRCNGNTELTKHSIVDMDRKQRTCVKLPATWGFSLTRLR